MRSLQSPRSSSYNPKLQPVTRAERAHWKRLEIARLERLAETRPADATMYRLAANRVRDELDAIERIPARPQPQKRSVASGRSTD